LGPTAIRVISPLALRISRALVLVGILDEAISARARVDVAAVEVRVFHPPAKGRPIAGVLCLVLCPAIRCREFEACF